MNSVHSFASRENYTYLILKAIAPAVEFYEKIGFVRNGELYPNGTAPSLVGMEMKLSGM